MGITLARKISNDKKFQSPLQSFNKLSSNDVIIRKINKTKP